MLIDKDKIVNQMVENIQNKFWWRMYDLRGMTLKLKKPLNKLVYPYYKGDRNFVTIHVYDPYMRKQWEKRGTSCFEIYEVNDWVIVGNELTTPCSDYIISLSLLDYDYFVEHISKNVQN